MLIRKGSICREIEEARLAEYIEKGFKKIEKKPAKKPEKAPGEAETQE